MNFSAMMNQAERGPWFSASFSRGDCSGCCAEIVEGDEIRADGEGGWERRECCGGNDEDQ